MSGEIFGQINRAYRFSIESGLKVIGRARGGGVSRKHWVDEIILIAWQN